VVVSVPADPKGRYRVQLDDGGTIDKAANWLTPEALP
jgi:hypothetical protein